MISKMKCKVLSVVLIHKLTTGMLHLNNADDATGRSVLLNLPKNWIAVTLMYLEVCILRMPTVGYEKERWWGLRGEKPFNHPPSFDLEIKELKWDVK